GLEGNNKLGGDRHRIDRVVRHGGVATLPHDDDVELVAGRHNAADAHAEAACREAGHVVHAVDFADAEALHQAVLHHGAAARAAFFGGLEDDNDSPSEIAGFGEISG